MTREESWTHQYIHSNIWKVDYNDNLEITKAFLPGTINSSPLTFASLEMQEGGTWKVSVPNGRDMEVIASNAGSMFDASEIALQYIYDHIGLRDAFERQHYSFEGSLKHIKQEKPLVVTIKHFERDAKGNRWQLSEQEAMRVDYQYRDNVRDNKSFFESLGGTEDYKDGKHISTSPDSLEKVERTFYSAHEWTDDKIDQFNGLKIIEAHEKTVEFDEVLDAAEQQAAQENTSVTERLERNNQQER